MLVAFSGSREPWPTLHGSRLLVWRPDLQNRIFEKVQTLVFWVGDMFNALVPAATTITALVALLGRRAVAA